MHELALSVSQVELRILVTIAHRLSFVLGQPLVGIHDLETHLSKLLFVVFVIILFLGVSGIISINSIFIYCAQFFIKVN